MHWYSAFSSSRTGPFQHRPCPQGAGEATTGIDTTRRMQITHSVLEFRRTSLGSGVRAGKEFPLWKDPVFGAFAFWFFGPVQCQGCITTQEARPKPGTSSGVQLGMSSPWVVMKKICPYRLKKDTSGQSCIEGKSRLCYTVFLFPGLFWIFFNP